VIYEDHKLKKCLEQPKDSHLFCTDIYKPKSYKLEKEIRFLIFLRERKDLYKLNRISETGSPSSERPEYLYYELVSQDESFTGPSIEKVFCQNQETHKKLCDMFDKKLVVLIG